MDRIVRPEWTLFLHNLADEVEETKSSPTYRLLVENYPSEFVAELLTSLTNEAPYLVELIEVIDSGLMSRAAEGNQWGLIKEISMTMLMTEQVGAYDFCAGMLTVRVIEVCAQRNEGWEELAPFFLLAFTDRRHEVVRRHLFKLQRLVTQLSDDELEFMVVRLLAPSLHGVVTLRFSYNLSLWVRRGEGSWVIRLISFLRPYCNNRSWNALMEVASMSPPFANRAIYTHIERRNVALLLSYLIRRYDFHFSSAFARRLGDMMVSMVESQDEEEYLWATEEMYFAILFSARRDLMQHHF